MKRSLLMIGSVAGILFFLVLAWFLYLMNRPFWELHFNKSPDSQVVINVVLDGENHGYFSFDTIAAFEPTVVIVRRHNVSLPFGKIRFADVTWPPGLVIVEVGDHEALQLSPGGTVELRPADWDNPPYYEKPVPR